MNTFCVYSPIVWSFRAGAHWFNVCWPGSGFSLLMAGAGLWYSPWHPDHIGRHRAALLLLSVCCRSCYDRGKSLLWIGLSSWWSKWLADFCCLASTRDACKPEPWRVALSCCSLASSVSGQAKQGLLRIGDAANSWLEYGPRIIDNIMMQTTFFVKWVRPFEMTHYCAPHCSESHTSTEFNVPFAWISEKM